MPLSISQHYYFTTVMYKTNRWVCTHVSCGSVLATYIFFIVLFYFCVVQPLRKPLRHTASILILSIRAEYKYDLYFETKSMHVCCLQIATLIFL